jgi:hypothetical protein
MPTGGDHNSTGGPGMEGDKQMPDFSKIQQFITKDLGTKYYQEFKEMWKN